MQGGLKMTEKLLFELYKDTRTLSNNRKRKRIQLQFPQVDMGNLHRRVVNYQVKKYGQSLN